jgi:hypothetical protein
MADPTELDAPQPPPVGTGSDLPPQPVPVPPPTTQPPDTEPLSEAPEGAQDVPDEPPPAAKPAPPKAGLPYKARVDFPPAPYTQVLAVRAEPSSSSEILARLPEGSIVTIVKVQGNWGAFKKGGWGSLTYIKPL